MEGQTGIESAAFELSQIIDLQTSGRLRLCWPELNHSYFHSEETIRRRYVWPGAQDRNYPSVCTLCPSVFKTNRVSSRNLYSHVSHCLFCVVGTRSQRSKKSFFLSAGSNHVSLNYQTVPTRGQGARGRLPWWLRW